MGFLLCKGHSVAPTQHGRSAGISDHQHIHVVVSAASGISGKVHVHSHYIRDERPFRSDVAADAPGVSRFVHPGSGVMPAADIHFHRMGGNAVYHLAYAHIPLFRIELQVLASAEIYLDEIKIPVVEVHLGILGFMAPESCPETVEIVIVSASAGVVAGIAVDAGLESKGMDMVDDRPHASGEAHRILAHSAVFAARAEISVIYIYMVVTCRSEPGRDHKVRLLHDESVGNVGHESIPTAPAHRWWCHGRGSLRTGGCKYEGCQVESFAHITVV